MAVQATGLCGSDLHYFGHFRNGDIQVREPLTLGHESAGVVTAVGAGVDSGTLKVGDRVALEVGQPCEACELCRAGRYNICRGMSFRSSAKAFPHAQGTLQDRINHPARWCHRLPDAVSLELGALVEPLAVAFHGRDRARLPPHATVLVLGAGAVGLLCAFACRAAGARAVVIADIQSDRTRFAVENGFADAAVTVPIPAVRPETIEDKLAYARSVAELVKASVVPAAEGGKAPVGEVSVTFECTGVESCMQTAIYVSYAFIIIALCPLHPCLLSAQTCTSADELNFQLAQSTQPGGKVMIIGMGTPVQTLPISAASLREVDLVGVFRYANAYPRVIEQLAAGATTGLPDVSKLITQRFQGLASIPSAFETAAKVKDEKGDLVLKVLVDMSG